MKKKIKIGTLISGGGTNLQAVIDSCANGKIDGEILFTGSDLFGVKGLERAENANINTFVVDYKTIIKNARQNPLSLILPDDFNIEEIKSKQRLINSAEGEENIEFFLKTRAAAEKELLDKIIPYNIDLLVLAGFMRVLTPYFIDRMTLGSNKTKIINIHPALLPAFPGTDGYGDTFRYGCKVGGSTVHYVDYGEDTGTIIGQRAFQIEDSDTLEIVKQKGLSVEWQLYPESIQKIAQSLLSK